MLSLSVPEEATQTGNLSALWKADPVIQPEGAW